MLSSWVHHKKRERELVMFFYWERKELGQESIEREGAGEGWMNMITGALTKDKIWF